MKANELQEWLETPFEYGCALIHVNRDDADVIPFSGNTQEEANKKAIEYTRERIGLPSYAKTYDQQRYFIENISLYLPSWTFVELSNE